MSIAPGLTKRLNNATNRLRYSLDLLRELVVRDLKVRYKRSALGILWSLLTPLSQVILLSFLFRRVLPLDIPNYTVFLFVGILSWSWFYAAIGGATSSITANPELVRKPGFPAPILPVLTVASQSVHFILALPVLFAVAALHGLTPGPEILALPLVIALQFILASSIAILVSALNVEYRDTQHITNVVLMLGFYITPIFYSVEAVPSQFMILYQINPFVYILDAYRAIIVQGAWPDFGAMAGVAAFSIVMTIASYKVFRRSSDRFAEAL